mmetsp:Transcript_30568/g.69947  ORF Transcript_30568/g.69947 Transcript_30568/m.69947 type:complete len:124 (+) Transcript_30568:4579-4950(+)
MVCSTSEDINIVLNIIIVLGGCLEPFYWGSFSGPFMSTTLCMGHMPELGHMQELVKGSTHPYPTRSTFLKRPSLEMAGLLSIFKGKMDPDTVGQIELSNYEHKGILLIILEIEIAGGKYNIEE